MQNDRSPTSLTLLSAALLLCAAPTFAGVPTGQEPELGRGDDLERIKSNSPV